MRYLVILLLFIGVANAQPMRFFQGAIGQYPPIVTKGLTFQLSSNNSTSFNNSTTSFNDISGNNNTFTLYNNPTFNTTNGYFTFNGSSQYIRSNSVVSIITYDITISFWFKTTTSSSVALFIETTSDYNTSGNGFIAYIGNGKLNFSDIYGINYNAVSTANTYNDGKWHNFTGIINRSLNSSNHNFIYIDGTLDNVQSGSPLNQVNYNVLSSNLLYLLSRGGTIFFNNSSVHSFYLYNRALTTAEITQNYNALKNRF
jgi:hypothetical protein